ncbi:GntR family transcriptional regulator [Nocardiopsis baichengensis]|uniref:GntR family transcriptional regulator n=1 Tax=Nocardiopsis baichengensis TaxID=280240 RepID=UPI000345E10B|nr:GntR family transcriptional regulator [Nocardiopsis baichengensis]
MARKRDPRPRHQQIAAEIRALIMSGDMPPGQRLPTTAQLMERYQVTSQTVQRTLGVLKEEGFLVGRAGVGVFVRGEAPLAIQPAAYMPPADGQDPYRWMTEAERRSQQGAVDLLSVEEVRPPQRIAEFFELGEDGRAVRRRQLLLLDGEPVELADVFFPAELAHGTALTENKRIRGGAPKLLADLGYPPDEWVDRVSTRLPTSEELKLLELPDDAPVLRTLRVVYGAGRPVQAEVLIKGGHLYELMYQQDIRRP